MAQNDKAVITAAVGYVFTATPGTTAPTPSELAALDPELFGGQTHTVVLSSGSATGGTFTVTVEGDETTDIAYDASAATVQAAIESLDSVGPGNVVVTGTSIESPGLAVTFIGSLQGETITVAVEDENLTGTTPVLGVSVTGALNGWKPVGHTSRNDMPEFGFEGGDTEVRGSWQNEKLREVTTETPADYLTLFLHQLDTNAFEMYYGENDSVTPGVFSVSGDAATTNERAFLVIIVDGTEKVAFHADKASVRRDDAIQMPVDDFASLPIRATFLKMPGRPLFSWINEVLFA